MRGLRPAVRQTIERESSAAPRPPGIGRGVGVVTSSLSGRDHGGGEDRLDWPVLNGGSNQDLERRLGEWWVQFEEHGDGQAQRGRQRHHHRTVLERGAGYPDRSARAKK